MAALGSSHVPRTPGRMPLSVWGRIKAQRHNFLGMAMMSSFFLLSTKLISMDKELNKVKESFHHSQEEADDMRRKMRKLQEVLESEVSGAGSNRESVASFKSRLQLLLDERFADMKLRAPAKSGAGSVMSSGSDTQQQGGNRFMV